MIFREGNFDGMKEKVSQEHGNRSVRVQLSEQVELLASGNRRCDDRSPHQWC